MERFWNKVCVVSAVQGKFILRVSDIISNVGNISLGNYVRKILFLDVKFIHIDSVTDHVYSVCISIRTSCIYNFFLCENLTAKC